MEGTVSSFLELEPDPAAAFMFSKVSVPYLLTAPLLITNSPGVSIAGTVSLLPLPGTSPPLLNP